MYTYISHPRSGETWAVEVNDAGQVIDSCGPLDWRDVRDHLPEDFGANMTDEDSDWMNNRWEK